MKIAFFHNLSQGGAKRVVFEQVKYLTKKHTITVYEIDQFDLKNNLPGFLNRFFKDFKNFYSLKALHKKIAKEIDNNNFDLVIVHPDRLTQAPFLLSFLKTPSIYFCEEVLRIAYEKELAFNRNVNFLKKWYEQVTRRIRKKIDKENVLKAGLILANSNFTAKNIKNAYGRKAKVWHLGVDSSIFRPLNIKKTIDVLFIGEKDDAEGYDLLKELLKDKKIKVKILARKNNKFTLSDKDLVKEYNQAKIVLALNKNEPFGLIPLEAMSCSTPVIAVNEGGFKETVKNNITGFLIKRDRNELLAKIKTLLRNDKLYNQMSKNCREDMVKNWDWKIRMREFEKYLKI